MLGAVVVLALVASATLARAADGARDPLHLETFEILRALDAPPPPAPAPDALSRLFHRLGHGPIGLGPIVTLRPPTQEDGSAADDPPTFALVGRAYGRAIVSITRPRARIEPGQSLLMQRTIVSDLVQTGRLSLAVYEDHALSTSTLRLMGIGARVTLRPAIQIEGWHVRLELVGGFGFESGASAFVALTGVPQAPPVPMPVR